MVEITGHPLYSCRRCRNPVALADDLLSKNFIASSGRAYLFDHAMNIVMGPKEDKRLITGYFTVANIFCSKFELLKQANGIRRGNIFWRKQN